MKILMGVFDWGLGHATRDSPLIGEMLKRGHKVDILSTGRALKLLKKKFGKRCKYCDVPSIFVPYPKHRFFALSFLKNIPRMLRDIKRATDFSKEIIQKGKYDKVISDCRYDVYDRADNSYLINHQLRFKAPIIVENVVEKWLASRIRKYKYVIVPDFDKKNLSGKLSHDLRYLEKDNIKYVGILSHVKFRKTKKDVDYFITISGPEPQRTILEGKIMPHLKSLKGNIVVTLGKPGEVADYKLDKRIKVFAFLDSKKQEEMMNRAKFIVSRSGYTTIMEIAELEKKNVLFIPTPGQTEQEYLGDFYEKEGYFHHVHQHKLSLLKDIEKARKFKGYKPAWKSDKSVKNFMEIVGIE